MGLDCLEHTLDRMNLTDGQLAELDVAVGKLESQQALTRELVGERCFGEDLFERLRSGRIPFVDVESYLDEDTYWIGSLLPLYKAAGLLEWEEKRYLDIMAQYVRATQLPAPQSIAAAGVVDDEVKRLFRWRVFSQMLLGSLDSTVRITERCDAKIRDARVAIAAERYRLAKGKLSSQLSDLVPAFLSAVPTDPFDGKLLRYKTLAKGYVVYSVGEDREDNGGTEKNSEGVPYGKGTDITFTVQR